MHPITYSFILNALALVGTVLLALAFDQPLLILIAIMLQTHIPTRHKDDDDDDDLGSPPGAVTGEYAGEGAGFLGKLSTR